MGPRGLPGGSVKRRVRIAGLGGTYGFPLISEIGADAEEACDALVALPC